MSTALSTLRTNLRTALDESTAHAWTDSQLDVWLNQGAQVVARRAEVLIDKQSIPVHANVALYFMPADVVRVHRMEFTPDAGQTIYPLEFRDFQEMDQLWGSRQSSSYSYPNYVILTGWPPNLQCQLFPVPSTAGSLNVLYYRLPRTAVANADLVEVPQGYDELVTLYAEYMALRKDADPRWTEAKGLFEEQLGAMIDNTRRWHDQAGYLSYGTSVLPQWLVGSDTGYGV